ncbi:NADP-dependent oxidoreductase [Sphingomonas abietis]|uniref:NADP-dependent oxidoreductase n=1 Tax=Sphingomonas abietis TaxID=3012344 RepID=A0ABY7NS16_9SPHN|nr:NADP-dependent oxidoreductase [Sphingomonas abietis]WBO24293.1 NADP-dependent oxidoreductase [Sphingomonas abietis]
MTPTNRTIVLASRPHGAPTPDNFRMEERPVPIPGAGELLLQLCYLSLDPYMRGRMNDAPSYTPPFELDAPLTGGAVSRVIESRNEGFAVGDLVLGHLGWQEYALSDGAGLTKLDAGMEHPSYALGALGMPGFTAWHGLLKVGVPRAADTVVVAGASGAVGSIVGQIASIKGARVVGVAGGPDKCRRVVGELGFDACVDHRDPGFAAALLAACPDGIDVYFENVGGAVFDAVLPLLNVGARVPVCGLIAHYNDASYSGGGATDKGPDRLPLVMTTILKRRICVEGFIISDHQAEHGDFLRDLGGWIAAGRVRVLEDVVDGLENAPEAFIGLLEGRNNGKLVIRATHA